MSPASMFGSHHALLALAEEGEGGKVPFHHATLPLDASTASLRELYAAQVATASAASTEESAMSTDDVARCRDNFGTDRACGSPMW